MWIIRVEVKASDQKFTFDTLMETAEIVHKDCYGGKTDFYYLVGGEMILWCTRCRAKVMIGGDLKAIKKEIIKIAIDGEKRLIHGQVFTEGKIGKGVCRHEKVEVVRKEKSSNQTTSNTNNPSCPSCGTEIRQKDTKFCAQCGHELPG